VDNLARLLAIMARLRDPHGGCPWDRRQTPASLVPYTLEEAYEVAEAVERGDMNELRDELGDLLFQIVFYSQIAREQGAFDFDQVAAAISDKMERRHPHVFGDADYGDDVALHRAWERHKAAERAARGEAVAPSQMDGVAMALPALVRAEKLQRRAARVGFDWPDAGGALDKVREEIDELAAELGGADAARVEEELGDLLFAMVNLVRLLGCDAEQALRRGNAKFERRFRALESRLRHAGHADLSALSLAELDAVWEAVKRDERGTGSDDSGSKQG
jgi:ATP diphosphatase